MSDFSARTGFVRFATSRAPLAGLMVLGYLGMIPTLGLYRFWMITKKRRFYWSETVIDGDALEYTGNPRQLLIGFMMAVLIFLPVYALLFYLSTQSRELLGLGYLCLGLVLWFLIGYAIYRTRDFRLSRTLWRGVRFDQSGSAMNYALRRFGWSILMVLTVGAIYPFLASNLWRYRYRHTWFGDRQFSITGSWKNLIGPYYLVYGVSALLLGAMFADFFIRHDYVIDIKGQYVFGLPIDVLILVLLVWVIWGVNFYRSREITRMFSSVRIGDAAITVRVRGWSMFWQGVVYCLAFLGAVAVFGAISAFYYKALTGSTSKPVNIGEALHGSLFNLILLILGYIATIGTLSTLAETILGFGYWKLIARDARIENIDSLATVHGRPEDKSLVGEGIASALNFGVF